MENKVGYHKPFVCNHSNYSDIYRIVSDSPMEKTEKSIRRIGKYFLVLGVICSCLVPMYFSILRLVGPICIILMCSPRLIYQNKLWASVLLMISAILATLTLLCFDGLSIMLSDAFGPMDVSDAIIIGVITVIALLSCYLCYRLCELLFKTKKRNKDISMINAHR